MADHYFNAADGTRLYARVDGVAGGKPVLCLPGLTRNTRDFDVLTEALVADYQVIRMDFRGRGRSAAADPASYRADVEATDVLALLDNLGIERPHVVGTSRGGIVGMILSATAGNRIGGLVLNDIGPVIELNGLLAIRSRMQATAGMPMNSWKEVVAALRLGMGHEFTSLSEAGWERFARQLFRDEDGRPVPDYDPGLLVTMTGFDPAVGMPPLWSLFDAIGERPLLAIRAVNSDLLTEETIAAMQVRRPDMGVHRVPDEGHAPLLSDEPTISAIRDFLKSAV